MTTAFVIESEPFGEDFRLALVVPDESKASGVGTVLGVETGGGAQTWTARPTGDNANLIVNGYSGLVLDVPRLGMIDGAQVFQSREERSEGQLVGTRCPWHRSLNSIHH
jgi:hypothetical protein